MTVYWEGDGIRLYHGDCREEPAWLDADVLICDPPYGMSYQSGWNKDKRAIEGDHDPQLRDKILDLWGTRPAAVFGTWRVPRPTATKQVLVWNKMGVGPGMGDLSLAFGSSHEDVYLLGRWEKRAVRRGSVITTESSPSSLTTALGHPTPKPVGLMEILVESAPDGVIADPFAGSGSTLVACRNLGRRAIGVETVEKYCEIIARRLDQGVLDFGDAS